MWPYWLMFALPAVGALAPGRMRRRQARVARALVGLVLALMVGLRHEVGGDWDAYLRHFWSFGAMRWTDAIALGDDPGYYGLSALIDGIGGGIYTLNLVCAALLAWGTVALAHRQPQPWLALLVAVPYLLIVVGMGYTRQAAAIGCVMLGLVALEDARVRWFVFWVFLGAAFHKTAVLMIPIAALAVDRNRIWTASWVMVLFALGAWLFLLESSQELILNYVESDYAAASQGAGIRLAMNAVPALLVVVFWRRLFRATRNARLWLWMAALALLSLPLLQVSATAVDRMALYFIPLQLVGFARLPQLAKSAPGRVWIAVCIVAYYGVVQYVWLHHADHAEFWVPYRFMPF